MGNDVTVIEERCADMFSFIFSEDSTEISAESYFMLDGAPAYSSRITMDWLNERFTGKLSSIKSDIVWHPRSQTARSELLRFISVGNHGRGSELEKPIKHK